MNSPDHWKKIEEIFHAALVANDRPSFLSHACGDEPEIRAEVEALLVAHEQSASFLDSPAWEEATALHDEPTIATQIQPPLKSFSHYQVISLLGKGGMGEVYLASDTRLGRKAAIKILPTRYTSEVDLVHRFEREAKAASALNHPNILTVYEIGETDDAHFMATEFIEGKTLRQRLKQGNFQLKEALEICLQIAAALTAAHEAGIIHRDIKPENIMLRPDGYVKVLDFGLAKLTEAACNPDDSTTQTGVIMGTPSYMSPEQARGQKVDHRTDVWSLGIILHEMVSGVRPFAGNTRADLMVAILDREPAPLPGNLPSELKQIVTKLLAKDPARRYATIKEFGQELKELRHKLEFASELKHMARQAEETTLYQAAETDTAKIAQQTQAELRIHDTRQDTLEQASALPAPIAPQLKLPRRVVITGLLLASGLGTGAWYFFGAKPAALNSAAPAITTPGKAGRELTWSLTAQRMQGNKLELKPFQSAGNDWFPNGSKFKFNLISPQIGYLYLLNEGLTKGGEQSLNLLYPTPKNNNLNAKVLANLPIQTDNYVFDEHEGIEKFWIVWAAQPVEEIEAAKANATPAIKNVTQSAAILALLLQHAPNSTAKADEAKELLTVTAESEILVNLVKLKHR